VIETVIEFEVASFVFNKPVSDIVVNKLSVQ